MADFEKYEKEGVKYDRVTSILGIMAKPALQYWFGKHGTAFCQKKLKDTAEFGTDVHLMVEAWCKGQLVEPREDTRKNKLFEKFVRWAEINEFECVESEITVYCDEFRYAGTMDLLCRVNGELFIADIKTAKDFYETFPLQLAAYQYALDYPEPVGRMAIRLGREDGKLETKKYEDHAGDLEGFKNAVGLYRWKQRYTKANKKKRRSSGKSS